MRRYTRPLVLTTLLIALAVTAFTRTADRYSENYTAENLRNAVITFASARALNSAISIFQESTVNVSVGVGFTVALGQMLDPINDMVEQFSWVVLVAIVSLGIQQLLLTLGASLGVNLVVAVLSLLFAWTLWRKAQEAGTAQAGSWLARVLVAMLVIRFAVPAMVAANQLVYALFLADTYQSAAGSVNSARDHFNAFTLEAEPPAPARQPAPDGDAVGHEVPLFGAAAGSGGFSQWMRDNARLLNPVTALEEIGSATTGLIDHIISLMVVFLMQTVLLPVAFLWLLYRVFRALLTMPAPLP